MYQCTLYSTIDCFFLNIDILNIYNPLILQETQLSLTNRATRLEVSQVCNSNIVPNTRRF